MSDIRNCSLCRSLFIDFAGSDLCPKCSERYQAAFSLVRDYIYDNPGGNAVDIARATGIDVAIIMRFLREGRLYIRSEHH